ncbi:DUF2809 domain-containing protein [Paenibacillus sp. NEAU-GSW1]|uniref:ribosomal maturation YjgA family protein n=1 Tax=Paenibacillus sp. NEAU-GSW1 TaxID=2682486 RepID=UPI0012E2DF0A|nr:DUF2809 domain-containing protein [Paenibacillus sp. NEAU-GSW1]
MIRFNNKYMISFILLFLAELVIALFLHDSFIRPYIGDMLVVVLMYCFIKSIFSVHTKLLPFYIFVFSINIEICQWYEFVKLIHMETNVFIKTLFGSVFDIKDIYSYFAGCLILYILQKIQQLNKSNVRVTRKTICMIFACIVLTMGNLVAALVYNGII